MSAIVIVNVCPNEKKIVKNAIQISIIHLITLFDNFEHRMS